MNEVAERLAFFAIAVNMVSYLVLEMGLSLPTAATRVNNWLGASYALTLLGAFLADAYLGRFRTIIVFSLIYAAVFFSFSSLHSVVDQCNFGSSVESTFCCREWSC